MNDPDPAEFESPLRHPPMGKDGRAMDASSQVPGTGKDGDANLDDRMLDQLLVEVIGDQGPPDLSKSIMTALREPVVTRSSARTSAGSNKPSSSQQSAGSSTMVWGIGVAVAILLAIGVGYGIQHRNRVPIAGSVKSVEKPENEKPENEKPEKKAPVKTSVAKETFVQPSSPKNANRDDQDSTAPNPTNAKPSLRKGPIELAGPLSPGESGSGPSGTTPNNQPHPMIANVDGSADAKASKTTPPPEMRLVSRNVQQGLAGYWNRIGIQPTKLRSPAWISGKFSDRLGVNVSTDAIGNPDAVLQELHQQNNLVATATQVLAAISQRDASTLTSETDQQMIGQLAIVLDQQHGFDDLLVEWLSASLPSKTNASNTPSWASLVRAKRSQASASHASVIATAAVTMRKDLRCQRCHDLPDSEEGKSTQEDYWQFASLVMPLIDEKASDSKGLFYDKRDGRRRLAAPGLKPSWWSEFGQDSDLVKESITLQGISSSSELQKWLGQLRGSRPLARGIVATLWEMVHGRPLQSSPFDLSGGPQDTSLSEVENNLVADLLASDFDVLRCLAILMTDPIVGRSVPEAMTPKGLLVASDEDWAQASLAIESFSAGQPESLPQTANQRLRLVQQFTSPTIPTSDGPKTILAQPLSTGDSGDKRPAKRKLSPAELAGLPTRSSLVTPAWLSELPNFESQLDHVARLAGQLELPSGPREVALQMQSQGEDPSLILQRVWWIIRPQG